MGMCTSIPVTLNLKGEAQELLGHSVQPLVQPPHLRTDILDVGAVLLSIPYERRYTTAKFNQMTPHSLLTGRYRA